MRSRHLQKWCFGCFDARSPHDSVVVSTPSYYFDATTRHSHRDGLCSTCPSLEAAVPWWLCVPTLQGNAKQTKPPTSSHPRWTLHAADPYSPTSAHHVRIGTPINGNVADKPDVRVPVQATSSLSHVATTEGREVRAPSVQPPQAPLAIETNPGPRGGATGAVRVVVSTSGTSTPLFRWGHEDGGAGTVER